MQLKGLKSTTIFVLLALLVCAWSRLNAGEVEHASNNMHTKTFMYTDSDGTTVIMPRLTYSGELTENLTLSTELEADIISSASVDVRTSATEHYRVDQGKDIKPFHEIRKGGNLNLSYRHNLYNFNIGGSISRENDFFSLTFNTGVSRDFFRRNTTVALGVAYSANQGWRSGDNNKDHRKDLAITTLNLSLTQALSRKAIMQIVLYLSRFSGWLESFYRYVPIYDEKGEIAYSVRENMPDTRTRIAVGLRYNRYLGGPFYLHGAYRLYTDTWDIDSHTILAALLIQFGENIILRARSRFYYQTQASFYEPKYYKLTQYRTYDRELVNMISLTNGLKLQINLPSGKIFKRWRINILADYIHFKYFNFPPLKSNNALLTGGGFEIYF